MTVDYNCGNAKSELDITDLNRKRNEIMQA